MNKIPNEIDTIKAMMKAAGFETPKQEKERKVDSMQNVINLYTDGACRGNQHEKNLGAFAYLLEYKGNKKEGAWTVENTTNNAMELAAMVSGLNKIRTTDIPIKVYSDSIYAINCATEWMASWRAKGYQKKGGLKNRALIMALDELIQRQDSVEFIHVKGHSGHPENEHVDTLCNEAMNNFVRV